MAKNKGGRPKGSTTRPQLREYMTLKEIKELVESAKKKAHEGDTGLMKFLLEQVFGKAVQPIGNDDGQPLIVKFDSVFDKKE